MVGWRRCDKSLGCAPPCFFVGTHSETFIHEQQRGMCVLEDSELHHRFESHAAGRLLHDCVVSIRATPSVLTHLDPKSDLTIRFL